MSKNLVIERDSRHTLLASASLIDLAKMQAQVKAARAAALAKKMARPKRKCQLLFDYTWQLVAICVAIVGLVIGATIINVSACLDDLVLHILCLCLLDSCSMSQ